MNVRECPDCKGKGVVGYRTRVGDYQPEELRPFPDWRLCKRCGGSGKVVCEKVKEPAHA